jgi:hypothetical protein
MLRVAPLPVPVPVLAAPEAVAPTGAGAGPSALSYPLIEQEKSNWCWSACTQMVERGRMMSMRSQCEIASSLLDIADCCGSGECNTLADAGQITRELQARFPGSRPSAMLDMADLIRELTVFKKAVLVGWQWSQSEGGHVVLVYGVAQVGGERRFLVRDPLPGSGRVQMTYLALRTANGTGTWVNTWIRL